MCDFEPLSSYEIQSKSDINNLAKAIKLIKPSWHVESYLSSVKNVKHRQADTRFRISAHIDFQLKSVDMLILTISYAYVQFVIQMK
jgi:hypothetical protein